MRQSSNTEKCPRCRSELKKTAISIDEGIILCHSKGCVFPLDEPDVASFVIPLDSRSKLSLASLNELFRETGDDEPGQSTGQQAQQSAKKKKRRLKGDQTSHAEPPLMNGADSHKQLFDHEPPLSDLSQAGDTLTDAHTHPHDALHGDHLYSLVDELGFSLDCPPQLSQSSPVSSTLLSQLDAPAVATSSSSTSPPSSNLPERSSQQQQGNPYPFQHVDDDTFHPYQPDNFFD